MFTSESRSAVTMRMKKLCFFIFTLCIGSLTSQADLNNDAKKDLEEKLSKFLQSNTIESLPLHSKTIQKKAGLENNYDEVVLNYRFDYVDVNGEDQVMLLPLVTQLFYEGREVHNQHHYHLNHMNFDDPELITHLQHHTLVPPDDKPLNLSDPMVAGGEAGLPLIIDEKIFGGRLKNGFFIEAGSLDAERDSNTIHFEVAHDWSGLLVEPNPIYFNEGLSRHRNASSANTCLGTSSRSALASPVLCNFNDFISIFKNIYLKALASKAFKKSYFSGPTWCILIFMQPVMRE